MVFFHKEINFKSFYKLLIEFTNCNNMYPSRT
jgi:hypothetical protein